VLRDQVSKKNISIRPTSRDNSILGQNHPAHPDIKLGDVIRKSPIKRKRRIQIPSDDDGDSTDVHVPIDIPTAVNLPKDVRRNHPRRARPRGAFTEDHDYETVIEGWEKSDESGEESWTKRRKSHAHYKRLA
jgi:hypothetical protein